MESVIDNKRKLWRPYETDDFAHPSPPKKRTRIFFTDEQRALFRQVYDPQTQAVIHRHVTSQLTSKQNEIEECLKDHTTVHNVPQARHNIPTMLTTATATTWTHPTLVSNAVVTKSTFSPNPPPRIFSPSPPSRTFSPSPPSRTFSPSPPPRIFSPSPPSRTFIPSPPPCTVIPSPSSSAASPSPPPCSVSPSPPMVEPCTLDSVVMVPFFRIPDQQTQSHRYVCAAKYLGFYQISDVRIQ